MVLELVDAALQVVEPINERMAAWKAFARHALPQQGLVNFARLCVLLKQYEPAEDEELALLNRTGFRGGSTPERIES